jgi:hypothetical protein
MPTRSLIAVDSDDLSLVLHALDCTEDCPPMQEVYRAVDRLGNTLNDHLGERAAILREAMTPEEEEAVRGEAKRVWLRVMTRLGRRGGPNDGA